MLNIISSYESQTGCSQLEKQRFHEEMESLLLILRYIPGQEDIWIGADLNATSQEQEHGLNENMEEIDWQLEMPTERRSYSLHEPMICE